MARLVEAETGRSLILPERALVGRDPECTLCLDHHAVSRVHARVSWDGVRWVVRDLGSLNGLAVDDESVPAGRDVPLRVGSRLIFGQGGAGRWELVDDTPPVAFAVRASDGGAVLSSGGLLVLEGTPPVSVYVARERGWWAERGDEQFAVADGSTVVADDTWTLRLPLASRATTPVNDALHLEESRLELVASRDMEHCRLLVHVGARTLDLQQRQHWFILWALTQARQEDRVEPQHDAGWTDIERLAKRTGIERKQLDSYISRARKELAEAGLQGAVRVVEARPGQRRLGIPADQVVLRS